jgi:hypothetical protein
MNGPLAYWGPTIGSPVVMLTPTERAMLLKLRLRLERAAARPLTEAVTALLAAAA